MHESCCMSWDVSALPPPCGAGGFAGWIPHWWGRLCLFEASPKALRISLKKVKNCGLDLCSALLWCLEAKPWDLVKPPSGYTRLQVPREGATMRQKTKFASSVLRAKPCPDLSIHPLSPLSFSFSPNGAETQAPTGRCTSPTSLWAER